MSKKRDYLEQSRKKEKQRRKELEEAERVGGKDIFAMLISAFVTIFPLAILIIAAICLFVLWLFGAF